MRLGPIVDHSEYIEVVDETIGVRLPRSYLAQGCSTGLTAGDTLVGGFTIVTRAPFRALLQLPDSSRSYLEAALGALRGRVVEANGLFLRPEVRDPASVLSFWRALVVELERADATYVLFSHCANSQKLRRFYAPVKPFALYVGPVRALEGMAGPEVERVALTSLANIAATIGSTTWQARRVAARAEASP